MGKGSNTTTSQTGPTPQAAAAYTNLMNQAQGVAATPYQAYTGELTAPVNAQQTLGINNINANAGFAQPAVNQAIGLASGAANPLTQQQIQNYQNPYTQDVVNATQAQFNNQNQQAQQGLTSNAIAQGALGGNRVGVAQANLAGQQQLAQAPVIAGLYNQSYQQGLNTAAQQYQQNPLAAAGSLANFGISGQGAALSGAGAQLGAGTVQQQTQQAADTANYGQYAQQQAYPFQTTQWLAGLDTALGSQLGGTSSTTGPAPNQTAQYLGLGLAGAGLFLNKGGAVRQHMASGGVSGTPWAEGQGWVPSLTPQMGKGAPSAPSLPQQPSVDTSKLISGITGLGKSGVFNSASWGGGNIFSDDAYGGSSSNPLPGLSAADYGTGFARGGVAGYADGGAPDDDRQTGLAMLRDAMLHHGYSPNAPAAANDDVVNPGDPIRMPDEQSVNDWRRGTPVPKGISPAAKPDDEEPVTAAPTQGVIPNPGAYKPPYEITPADYAPPAKDSGSAFGLGYLSPNAKSGLLAAGLGMLANRSPFLGTAVGEGGLQGLSAYGSAEERDRKAAEEAQKLSLEAKKAANDLAHQTFVTNETSRHNIATEHQAEVNADRSKFMPIGSTLAADGSLHPLVMDQGTGKIIDGVTGKLPSADSKFVGKNDKGAAIPDEDAKAVATRYVKTGDRTQLQGLGVSGQARQKVNHYIGEVQKELGVSDEELGQKVAEFEGRKAGQRTLGTQEAKMGSAAFEAEGAIKQARGVIERLPRTSFLPFNKLIQGAQTNTLNPDQAELYARTQAIVNTYSAVMARGANVTTDSSRDHANALLNTAADSPTFNRVLDTMLQEIDMAKKSPERMRDFYRQQFGAKSIAPEGQAASGATQSAPAFTPPPGAVPQTHGNKVYYYDPQTKQPYPGQ